ncbi:MAG: hypothetical protein KAV87_49920 [Desulfobacteraceae bacterium]|nr:hypothetical protein [Desulfobacteraceae bacterium]
MKIKTTKKGIKITVENGLLKADGKMAGSIMNVSANIKKACSFEAGGDYKNCCSSTKYNYWN